MTTHRERVLGQARADLVALPGLCAELERCVNERGTAAGMQRKVSGSPALIRLDVLSLLDPRRKPGWDGCDPREENYTDWLGVAPLLESWVRVVWEDIGELLELTEVATVRSEAAVLVEHWSFIEGALWGEELAEDVSRAAKQVRLALGIREAQRYKCPECGNPAHIVPGGILSCQEGHERVVRDLEQQQRRRPAITAKEVQAEFRISPGLLRQWKLRRKIKPARSEHGRDWWFPWDVFCLINPDIADAIRLRDELEAVDLEQA